MNAAVLREQIGGEEKRTYSLDARLLVFDFREMAVVYQRPILLEFIDVGGKADDVAVLRAVAQGGRTDGLPAGFISALRPSILPSHQRCTFQVVAAAADDEDVAATFAGGDPARVARLPLQLSDTFQDYMAAEAGLSFVPGHLDHLVGGAMASRFADGRVYTFSVPDPDYAVTLALADTRKIEAVSRPGYRTLVYGVYLDVRVAFAPDVSVFGTKGVAPKASQARISSPEK